MKLEASRRDGHQCFTIKEGAGETPDMFFPRLDQMFSAIKSAYAQAPGPVLFDLYDLDRVDSSIIALLVQTVRLAGTHRVSLITPRADTIGLLHLVGLDKLIDIYDSEDAWREHRPHERP